MARGVSPDGRRDDIVIAARWMGGRPETRRDRLEERVWRGMDDQQTGQAFPHHIFKLRLIPTQGSSFLFWTPLPRSVSKSTRGSAAASLCLPVYLSLVYCSSLHKHGQFSLKSTPIDHFQLQIRPDAFSFSQADARSLATCFAACPCLVRTGGSVLFFNIYHAPTVGVAHIKNPGSMQPAWAGVTSFKVT